MDTSFIQLDPDDEGTTILKILGITYPQTVGNTPESLNIKEHWYETLKSCMT